MDSKASDEADSPRWNVVTFGGDPLEPMASVDLYDDAGAAAPGSEEMVCVCTPPGNAEPGDTFTCPDCGKSYTAKQEITWKPDDPFGPHALTSPEPDVFLTGGSVSLSSPGDGE